MAEPKKNDAVKGKLTQEELYREIVEYLEINNICTLAFAYHDVPRATPVEYRNDGATLYVVSEGMSRQFYQAGEKNKVIEWKELFIERNQRCCVGLISPYFGYKSTRGLRMWGKAQVFHKGDAEWKRGCDLLKVERQLADFNQTEIPDFLIVTKIVPEMMQYFNMVKGIKRALWIAPGVDPDAWNCPWE
ncbi:MAG: hypothetical protein NTZ51_01490 [Proteobacteria bacterium]|nr:hypothetical protein [Pseudomonadota bacterium]